MRPCGYRDTAYLVEQLKRFRQRGVDVPVKTNMEIEMKIADVGPNVRAVGKNPGYVGHRLRVQCQAVEKAALTGRHKVAANQS